LLKEFKNFIARGNIIDLAIAVFIGASFSLIITSLVRDIVMLPIDHVFGGMDFNDLFISLNDETFKTLAAAREAGTPVIAYGNFLNMGVNFLTVAFAIFIMIKNVNCLKKPAPAPPPATKECTRCLSTVPVKAIRSGLAQRNCYRADAALCELTRIIGGLVAVLLRHDAASMGLASIISQ
jgi:large conductance mechanosensitive channel